ncbi:MAG: class I SAM-dependent methyltransferase [Patescibacteria group bacterium]|jgi:hypothetical protein
MIIEAMKKITIRSEIPMFLKQYNINRRIAEIGVRFGCNFDQLLSCGPTLAVAVDHWALSGSKAEQDTGMSKTELDKVYSDFVMRHIFDGRVKVLRMRSDPAVPLFPMRFFDYVYIDADHSYEGCLRDMGAWWTRVRQGGVMAGHDYIDTKSKAGTDFGVIRAV